MAVVWVVPAAVPAGSQHGSELGARNVSNIQNSKGAITSQLLVFKNCTSISNEGGDYLKALEQAGAINYETGCS